MARSERSTASNSQRTGPQFRSIPGSEKQPLPGAYFVRRAHPRRCIEVTVQVRPRAHAARERLVSANELGSQLPLKRHYLTREAFATEHGADPSDIHEVATFASQNRLRVIGQNVSARTLHLSGTVANFSRAFHVALYIYRHAGKFYRGRVGPVSVPAALEGVIQGVFGLDTRPVAKPHFRRKRVLGGAWAHAEGASYSPDQIAKLYNFPAGATGAGQCVGIIELGGGYTVHDLNQYFQQLGIDAPQVVPVRVQGARNLPTGNPNGPDGEVMLDIEVVGAVAPGARIAVYFAPNTDQGFVRAINRAVHDKINQPSVISISWGGPESSWTRQSIEAIDSALQAASLLGVTVCIASGDGGSTDGEPGLRAHVDFPASSPYALACGGTGLLTVVDTVLGEWVWNDGIRGGASGGGISNFFPIPAWQSSAGVPVSINPGARQGRGVPDVAGNADPNSGYQVRVDGVDAVFGGTSAVAPLWAGLIARLNESLGTSLGYWNPLLYGPVEAAGALRDITQGNNDMTGMTGGYSAGTGWDACTGFGSPDGTKLLAALQGTVGSHTTAHGGAAAHKKRAKRAAKSSRARARR
jgi:kumamolisin